MWFLLHLIPDSFLKLVVHGITALGAILFILSIFAKRIKLIASYGLIMGLVSLVLLFGGIYLEGGYGVEMMWRQRAADLQNQIKLSEERAKTINAQIETKIVKEIELVHDVKTIIKTEIQKEKEIIDADCKIPKEAVDILNNAAMDPFDFQKLQNAEAGHL